MCGILSATWGEKYVDEHAASFGSPPMTICNDQSGMSGQFLRFIGVAEFPGALGLILPGLFGIQTRLTPLAAGGLWSS
jgi:hypothetical protein